MRSLAVGNLVADVEAHDCRRHVGRAVAELSLIDQRVLGMRFGLDGSQFTLREVAWLLQVTPERVRQIEARALRRLRRVARRTGLADYIEEA